MTRSPRANLALKWTGIVIGTLAVLVVAALLVLQLNANALRGPIARAASTRLGRPVHIDGPLQLQLLSFKPHVTVHQLRLGNPDWAREHGEMARIGELQLWVSLLPLLRGQVVVPYVGLEDTDLHLLRNASNQANWRFSRPNATQPKSGNPPKLPIVRSLHIGRGHLTVQDAIRKLKFDGTVSANQGAGGKATLGLNGNGDINGAPFQLVTSGDPLVTAEEGKPYTFTSDIRAGRTHVSSRIRITKPFDLGSLQADISASGDDFADLYYLSGLALPNSAPYAVSGTLQREGTLLKLVNFQGKLGNSDMSGSASIDTSHTRPFVRADLTTHRLDMADLAPTLGARQQHKPSSLTKGAPRPEKTVTQRNPRRVAAGATLLPDAKLDLERVRGMDAVLHYHAESVQAKKLSIREIALNLELDRGVMTFEPVSFVLPQGTVTNNIRVDATQDVPEVTLDTRLTRVQLSQFKTKSGDTPLEGTLVGRAKLHGRGRSIHEVASTATGSLSIVIPHGEIREAFVELLGIDAARGLGLLLSKNQEQTNLRCGVADFEAQGGVFAADAIVLDTDNVLITGKGEVDLGSEVLDLSLNGQPKKFRLVRIRAPITIGGTLKKPQFGLKPGNTVGQAGLAAVLGAVATPLASVLAFIDPGLAKDADCGALLTEAKKNGAPLKEAQRSTKARSIT